MLDSIAIGLPETLLGVAALALLIVLIARYGKARLRSALASAGAAGTPPLGLDAVKESEWLEIQRARAAKVEPRLIDHIVAVLERRNGGDEERRKAKQLFESLKDIFKSCNSVLLSLDAYWSSPPPQDMSALISILRQVTQYPGFASQLAYLIASSKGETVGLAFSGGGIRSATFNLGVLQAVAKLNLLPCIDYLSTVSGGGYIGSWLLVWLKRSGFAKVARQLSPDWNDHEGEEPLQLEFLRAYSNYLTPQLGLLSADTWSLVATWVRNILLNLTILVLVISALLLLPRVVVTLSQSDRYHASIYGVLTVALLLIAISFAGRNLELFKHHQDKYPSYSEQWFIQWTIIIPTVLASWLGSCWLWNEGRNLVSAPTAWRVWMVIGAAVASLVWLVASLVSLKNWVAVVCALPEGAVGGLLFFGIARLYHSWAQAGYPGNHVHFVALGTALVAAIFGLMLVLQIGLMGTSFHDPRREWWSRVSAWVTIYSLAWVSLFSLALYSPLMVTWAGKWVSGAATLGWLVHTITGAAGGRSAKTGAGGPSSGTGILIKAAPPVFVVGLLALLSFGIYRVGPTFCIVGHHQQPVAHQEGLAVKVNLDLSQDSPGKSAAVSASVKSASVSGRFSYGDLAKAYWKTVFTEKDGGSRLRIFVVALVCALLAFLLSSRVDINEFSMHLLYRNRLVRCYLGASHQAEGQPSAKPAGAVAAGARNPNPFTGFDPDDDLLLADLVQDAPGGRRFVGPYPILNTTLNVTHGKRLAWQERKAESFSFTPLYCGFDVKPDRAPSVQGREKKPLESNGYRPTRDYLYPGEGPYLGTAMAISGAAASPNMGYHSSTSLAFLMTVLDVRLGWWAGNPRRKGSGPWPPPWMRRGPALGILYLLLELFGSSDDERGYIYLSDGGHFENLGIYELVRRRCRYIIVGDGSADSDLKFEDLGNAIRKCRADFGVEIDIDVERIRRDASTSRSRAHCAVGKITYPDSQTPGTLVYLKPSLRGDEPTDILQYASAHSEFPHQTTADQWFDESQFESYRKLGCHIAETTFGSAKLDADMCYNKEAFFKALERAWYPPSQAIEKSFTKHTKTYDELMERLRQDSDLSFLDVSLYPGFDSILRQPQNDKVLRKAFYFCNSLIQLMENVFLDLDLQSESELKHPHNAGWIKLFQQWAKSPVFVEAWKISSKTYGESFRKFCHHQLHLPYVD